MEALIPENTIEIINILCVSDNLSSKFNTINLELLAQFLVVMGWNLTVY